MITEILGALIVLGAALVLIMRHFLSKGKAKEKESVVVSASRLRYEIERSGDAVIGRMQIHVERLERLLAEANAQKAALDERLAALAQWEKVYGAQLGALPRQMEFAAAPPAAQAPPPAAAHHAHAWEAAQQTVQPVRSAAAAGFAAAAAPAVRDAESASSFQTALMEHMQGGAVGSSIDLQLPPEEVDLRAAADGVHDAAMMQENSRQESPLHNEATTPVTSSVNAPDDAEAEDDDAEDDEAYEYEYEEEDDEAETEDEYEESEEQEEDADEADDDELTDEADEPEAADESEDSIASAEEEEDENEDEDEELVEASPSDAVLSRQQEQIRAFLRQGLSVEEVSQRLGLGVGAVELVRHMEKRIQEAKEEDLQADK